MIENKINKNEIIKVENLFRSYLKSKGTDKTDRIEVLKGLNFTVTQQEFVGIMGKSGCGKTTLLKVLGLIDPPTSGNIYFYGKNTENLWSDELANIRRREIGFVFQDYYLMNSLSVKENMILPMVLDKQDSDKCMKCAEMYASRFGIMHLLDKRPYELSGGEKQRVAISRALINNPNLILADEPTGNLDSKSGQIVVEAFKEINETLKKTIIMVTHDPQVASYCKRIMFLKDGIIVKNLIRKRSQEEFYNEILNYMKLL